MKSATRLSDILCGGHLRATYGFVCISEREKSLPYKGHRILYDYAFSVCLHMTVLIASVLSRLLGHASSHSLRGPSICIPLLGTQTSEPRKVRSYRQRSPTLKGPHVRTMAPAVCSSFCVSMCPIFICSHQSLVLEFSFMWHGAPVTSLIGLCC